MTPFAPNRKRATASLLPVLAFAAVCVVLTAACQGESGGPPEIVVDLTPCSHCGMLISEPRYAAAYRSGSVEKVFDDIGCLLEDLTVQSDQGGAEVWVRDIDDASWISTGEATFVHAANLKTPMAGNVVASANGERAGALATEHDGEVIASFADLLAAFMGGALDER